MSEQTQILLMTPDASLVSLVIEAIAPNNGHVLLKTIVHDPRELPSHLAQLSPPVVLVDLDPQPRQTLAEVERLIARFPASRFVGLSSSLRSELLLEAMQAGLRSVITRQALAAELQPALNRLSAAGSYRNGGNGDLLLVLSAGGGSGATTIAVNLAEEFARQHSQPSLLIDLDYCYGACATYLGIEPRYAFDHILNYNGPIDVNLIRSTATYHGDTLHVLASPASIQSADPSAPNFSRLEQAMNSARQAYRCTVVDAPRVSMDVAADLISAATHTLLIFQLTVKDIHVARAMLDNLSRRGVSHNAIHPIANRYVKRQTIDLEAAGKALGGIDVGHLRNDYTAAINALNFGQTLAQAAPRSALRHDLQELLTTLSRARPTALAAAFSPE